MCLICVEMEKERLTFNEAWRNFREMREGLDEEHKKIVKQKLIDKMVEENKRNEET